ncbi:MAG: DUF501 domain-containing protein [Acidimicrobiales bacterium]|nr:MAG: DUF501 domain-containing protein [Acidimicrobiales bacterium]
MSEPGPLSELDHSVVECQLGRPARGAVSVAHRCPCGLPDVVRTMPRLADGTPFPTTFYLTCPKVSAALSRLESAGLMAEMTQRLGDDSELAQRYAAAHVDYLTQRNQLGEVAEIDQVSAGGMPTRVKCLHALVAHALARGPGVNPLGDEALGCLPTWWAAGPCVTTRPCVATTETEAEAHSEEESTHAADSRN